MTIKVLNKVVDYQSYLTTTLTLQDDQACITTDQYNALKLAVLKQMVEYDIRRVICKVSTPRFKQLHCAFYNLHPHLNPDYPLTHQSLQIDAELTNSQLTELMRKLLQNAET